MSEKVRSIETTPQDPELLPCQTAIKALCDEILASKSKTILPFTFGDVASTVNPNSVQELLRSSGFGDLLLKDGDSLSALLDDERYPDLDLYIGQADVTGVIVRAWGWEFDKTRVDQDSSTHPPYKLIYYPDEQDWTRQLDISLQYSNGKHTARQKIMVQTSSLDAGELPSVSRSLYASDYAETGYQGHNLEYRKAQNATEVDEFIALVRELIIQR